MQKRIGISVGDINGIGIEIILKSLPFFMESSEYKPILFCHKALLEFYADLLSISLPQIKENSEIDVDFDGLQCIAPTSVLAKISLGKICSKAGKYAMESIKKATESILEGKTLALVTAPISKEAIQKAGYMVPGHTEYLAQLCGNFEPLMVLATDKLRVALTTIHIPVSKISESITFDSVRFGIQSFYDALIKDFGIPKPKLAVLGLNPHAGDGGVIGREELEIISPCLNQFKEKGALVDGPFAADGFFGSKQWKNYDGILAMYHDQGLIPFKTIAFHDGVNITCNLPIVRTSPDHGTGFSIAGKGQADASSFIEAYKTAQIIIQNRGKHLNQALQIHETN